MRIISWNVNGIRALHRKEAFDWLLKESPDVFCLQETKAHPDQLIEEIKEPKGYVSHFDFSKLRKGYSGTAIYSKELPLEVYYALGGKEKELDLEGRLVVARFKDFVLLNCYFPNGGGGPERLAYKLRYYKEFLKHVKKLEKKYTNIIFCGDVNTAHNAIDLARPKQNKENTGFLPIERAWIDDVVKAGFTDSFRHFEPTKEGVYTYWDMKTRARDRNVGWRIDYFFVSESLKGSIKGFTTHADTLGSDHCPIEIEISI